MLCSNDHNLWSSKRNGVKIMEINGKNGPLAGFGHSKQQNGIIRFQMHARFIHIYAR